MEKYECNECGKKFHKKQHYEYHMQRKTSCVPVNPIVKPETKHLDSKLMRQYLDECKCAYCEKVFTRKDNLIHHIKYNCKKVKEIEEEKYKIFTKLKEKEDLRIKKLEEELSKIKENFEVKLKEKDKEINDLKKNAGKIKKVLNNTTNSNNNISNSNNIDNSINTQNNNNNLQNIYLMNYNANNMPALTSSEIIEALKRGFQTPVELTRKIHFNPKFPEFHNVYIPRINERYGMIYMDGDWKIMDKDELVEDIYESKRAFVVENLETYINQLDEFKIKSLKRWLDRDDDDEGVINTKNDIKKLLFNNRKMAMNRKKEIDNLNKKKKLEIVHRQIKKIKEVESSDKDSSDSDSSSDEESNYSYVKSEDK
jgi:hypothetical protein